MTNSTRGDGRAITGTKVCKTGEAVSVGSDEEAFICWGQVNSTFGGTESLEAVKTI